jgi:hypothetical protein
MLDIIRDMAARALQTDTTDSPPRHSTIVSRVSIKRQIAGIDDTTGRVMNEYGDSNPANIPWPIIRGSPRLLQIVAENKWGIMAFQRASPDNPLLFDWQLQLLSHNPYANDKS